MKSRDKKLLTRRLMLAVYDVFAVFFATVFGLLARFDFSWNTIPDIYIERAFSVLFPNIVFTIVVFYFFRLYTSLWTYAGMTELFYMIAGCIAESVINMLLVLTVHREVQLVYPMPRSYYFFYGIGLLACTFASRYFYRLLRAIKRVKVNDHTQKNVLLVGAGEAANALVKEIKDSHYIHLNIVGLVDDNPNKLGKYMHGIKVVGNCSKIPEVVDRLDVQEIIIAIPSASPKQIKEILEICKSTGCELKRLPGIYQLVNGEVSVSKLKDVDVNDLLGRDPIRVDLDSIMGYVSGKVVLVTGGGGTIGSELCRQIAVHKPKQLIIFDIYENSTYEIQLELKHNFPDLDLVTAIGSVRNTKRVDWLFSTYHPEIVYHAAAHKHVPLMEDSPNEAIKNNVLGTWKVVKASDQYQVKRFVMISTDKAVNPTNIMGASKRICEMIIQTYNNRSQTEYVAVRFGNVLGSNGSVIPIFKKQIEEGGPVTVTHPDIIRYFMTIPEAVSLVLQAGAYAKGGEIFVLDMGEPVKILDLAKNLILLSGHKPNEDIMIEFTGLRPGEKLYEEMLMDEEGLQDTQNKLIHIGKPIEFDEELFLSQLQELADHVVEEPTDIREWVQKIVPTYVPAKN
jgi:FlaA1/EpsC-like NDP-sugar epimerase